MGNWTTWYLRTTEQPTGATIAGVPPLTFESDGNVLTNWKITGSSAGVGDATDNLFDSQKALQGYKYVTTRDSQGNISIDLVEDQNYILSDYIPCEDADAYSCSLVNRKTSDTSIQYYCFDANKQIITEGITANAGTFPLQPQQKFNAFLRITDNVKYFQISLLKTYQNIMLTKSATAQDYEPFGYRIPIECNGQTYNAYIPEPLYANDSIRCKEARLYLPTKSGENTLDIKTANPPSSVMIRTHGASQGLKDYLKAQFIIDNH